MQVTLPPALVIHQPHQVRQLQPTTCCSCACINDLQACVITAWASCGGVQRCLASGPPASVVCLSALGTDMVHAAFSLLYCAPCLLRQQAVAVIGALHSCIARLCTKQWQLTTCVLPCSLFPHQPRYLALLLSNHARGHDLYDTLLLVFCFAWHISVLDVWSTSL